MDDGEKECRMEGPAATGPAVTSVQWPAILPGVPDCDIPCGAGVADMLDMDVHVRELRQLFNEIDPSPFNKRDLDPSTERFIVEWATEAPASEELRLVIHADTRPVSDEAEDVVRRAVPEFFAGRAVATRRGLRGLFHRGRISLLIGLGFMAVALTVASLLDRPAGTTALAAVLRESLLVGGWVAMWRPIEIFLYDWWPVLAKARRFDRLAAMPVEIRYGADMRGTAST